MTTAGQNLLRTLLRSATLAACLLLVASVMPRAQASDEEEPVEREYVAAPAAPAFQSWADADQKSAGCVSCRRSALPGAHRAHELGHGRYRNRCSAAHLRDRGFRSLSLLHI